jgi:hypothetical protein
MTHLGFTRNHSHVGETHSHLRKTHRFQITHMLEKHTHIFKKHKKIICKGRKMVLLRLVIYVDLVNNFLPDLFFQCLNRSGRAMFDL